MFRIGICDDSEEDRKIIRKLILSVPCCPKEVIFYEYHSGEELLRDMNKDHNLVFIDMQMEGMNGQETAEGFRDFNKQAVLVFCTGIVLPTTEAFKVQPFRYIMKYFGKEQLKDEMTEIIDEMLRKEKIFYLTAVQDGKVVKVRSDDIIYACIYKRLTRIYLTKEGEKRISMLRDNDNNKKIEIICKRSLQDVYSELRDFGFEYAHNSYIVNFQYVIRLEDKYIKVESGIELNLSRSKKMNFDKRFSEYLGSKYRRSKA